MELITALLVTMLPTMLPQAVTGAKTLTKFVIETTEAVGVLQHIKQNHLKIFGLIFESFANNDNFSAEDELKRLEKLMPWKVKLVKSGYGKHYIKRTLATNPEGYLNRAQELVDDDADDKCGYAIISGKQGVGKTVFAKELAKRWRGEDSTKQIFIFQDNPNCQDAHSLWETLKALIDYRALQKKYEIPHPAIPIKSTDATGRVSVKKLLIFDDVQCTDAFQMIMEDFQKYFNLIFTTRNKNLGDILNIIELSDYTIENPLESIKFPEQNTPKAKAILKKFSTKITYDIPEAITKFLPEIVFQKAIDNSLQELFCKEDYKNKIKDLRTNITTNIQKAFYELMKGEVAFLPHTTEQMRTKHHHFYKIQEIVKDSLLHSSENIEQYQENITTSLKPLIEEILCQNKIGDEGAKALGLKLHSNCTKLDLYQNKISAERAKENAKIQSTTDSNELFSLLQKKNNVEEFILERKTGKFPLESLKRWLKDDSSKNLKTLKIITEDAEVTADLLIEVCCDRVDLVLHLNGKNIELSGIKKATLELANIEFFDVTKLDKNEAKTEITKLISLISQAISGIGSDFDKAVLILGYTGAGKSTLAHIFANKNLEAFEDEDTNEVLIKSLDPLGEIRIGPKEKTEITIPNKINIGDCAIFDCPGFEDTSLIQEIANSFYIRQILNFANSFKLVLVVEQSDLYSKSGNNIASVTKAFFKSTDVNDLSSSSFVVVTHSTKEQNFVKNKISRILEHNNRAQEESINQFWSHIVDKNQISVFRTPKDEGKILNPPIWEEVEKIPYLNANHIFSSLYICDYEKLYLNKEILPYFTSNLNQLLHVVFDVIIDVDSLLQNKSNLLEEKKHLIKDWLTEKLSTEIINNDNQSGSTISSQKIHFPELNLYNKIINKLSTMIKDESGTGLITLSKMLKYFSNFDNIKTSNLLEKYSVAIANQGVFLKFLYSSIDKDLSSFKDKLFKAFENTLTILGYKLYSESIPSLEVKQQQDQDYYEEAIEYFDTALIKFQELKGISKQVTTIVQAKIIDCHYNLGNKEQVVKYSLESIKSNKEQLAIYNTLGKIFCEYKKYDAAVKSYKVVSNSCKITSCFDEWLESDPENPEIMQKRGDHLKSINRFTDAMKYYQDARGLSFDNSTRNELLKKMNQCINPDPVVKETHVNYDLVPELENSLNQILLGGNSYANDENTDLSTLGNLGDNTSYDL